MSSSLLKKAAILALIVIIGIQIVYIFGNFWEHIEISFPKLTSIIAIIFATIFLISLWIVYKKNEVDKERERFTGRNLMSTKQYDIMRLRNTKKYVDQLKNSEQYKQWVNGGNKQGHYSNSKTYSSNRDQNAEDFMKLWGGLEGEYFEIDE